MFCWCNRKDVKVRHQQISKVIIRKMKIERKFIRSLLSDIELFAKVSYVRNMLKVSALSPI